MLTVPFTGLDLLAKRRRIYSEQSCRWWLPQSNQTSTLPMSVGGYTYTKIPNDMYPYIVNSSSLLVVPETKLPIVARSNY